MNRINVSFTGKAWSGFGKPAGGAAEATVGFEIDVEEGHTPYTVAQGYLADAHKLVHNEVAKKRAAPAAQPEPEPEPERAAQPPAPPPPPPQAVPGTATGPRLLASADKTVEIGGLKCFWISDKSILVGDPRASAGKDNDKKAFLPMSKITTTLREKDQVGSVTVEKWLFKENDDDDVDRAAGKRFLRAIVAGGVQQGNTGADTLADEDIPF